MILAFCYGSRGSDNTCAAKEGNPFGPYWDKFGVDFDDNAFYGPLSYDLSFPDHKKGWATKFGPDKYPVLAFTGAPGAFPVAEKDVQLQKYLKFCDKIDTEATNFLAKLKLEQDDKIIGLHLRNGLDFVSVKEEGRRRKKSNLIIYSKTNKRKEYSSE